MKTSLSHLPENKRYEIHRIAEIIRDVVNPEKIILFGSHAKGTHVEHRYQTKDGIIHEYISDYDFLVVTKDNPEKTYVQESKIMDRVDHFNPPVNLEIHEIDYINEGLGWGQYFFADIVKEGILLYDTGKVAFPEPRQLTPAEEKEKALEYFETWYRSGTKFLRIAEQAFKDSLSTHDKLNEVAFILHQATESLYYTTLLVFTGYKPKTHNLWKLRKKTKPYSEELFLVFRAELDKQEEQLFDLLKRGYIEARYKQKDYHITADELTTILGRVKTMSIIVDRICKEKIDSQSQR
jgi:predicted nucleotidyltransferase/HEPN domain-containing protein